MIGLLAVIYAECVLGLELLAKVPSQNIQPPLERLDTSTISTDKLIPTEEIARRLDDSLDNETKHDRPIGGPGALARYPMAQFPYGTNPIVIPIVIDNGRVNPYPSHIVPKFGEAMEPPMVVRSPPITSPKSMNMNIGQGTNHGMSDDSRPSFLPISLQQMQILQPQPSQTQNQQPSHQVHQAMTSQPITNRQIPNQPSKPGMSNHQIPNHAQYPHIHMGGIQSLAGQVTPENTHQQQSRADFRIIDNAGRVIGKIGWLDQTNVAVPG